MIRGPRSGQVPFRPRARLLRLLGAELISDDVVAVVELVKNAYDADASTVTVEFRGLMGATGEIVVRDDGSGMDLDTLLAYWMEPGGTSKAGADGHRTRRGRRVLGEKGIGRFAADKLARFLELTSRRAGTDDEVRAAVDWDQFESESMLSDIKTRWEVRPAIELARQGTVLRMTGLRRVWTERMFRRLCTRLARLRSPFRELDKFTIRLESDEFPQYAGELRADILDRAPYNVEAIFDGLHTVEVRIAGSRPVKHAWTGENDLACGPVRTKIYAFDLETEALSRVGPRVDVRPWLREWSGISIYRDGFRVWPYGEPHDDWLRLDQRRVNNPVVRLSNNQIVGFVEVGRDRNPELKDQTNREGLLNNPAFGDLRRLLYFVLQILEAHRQSIRHPVKRTARRDAVHDTGAASAPVLLERIATRVPSAISAEIKRLARGFRTELDREKSLRVRLVGLFSELAAAGQVGSVLSSSVRALIPNIRRQMNGLRGELNGLGTRGTARLLVGIEQSLKSLDHGMSALTIQGGELGGRRRAIDVVAELRQARLLLAPLLEAHSVRLEIRARRNGVLRVEMHPESLQRIACILASNSIDALKGRRGARIEIRARAVGDRCEIVFADNGTRIPSELGDRVFEPGLSEKEGGRGMSLAIVRTIVTLHRGEITFAKARWRRGVTFRIVLPRKRARATMDEAQ
jgi:signal transduction histidine kinase